MAQHEYHVLCLTPLFRQEIQRWGTADNAELIPRLHCLVIIKLNRLCGCENLSASVYARTTTSDLFLIDAVTFEAYAKHIGNLASTFIPSKPLEFLAILMRLCETCTMTICHTLLALLVERFQY